MTDITKEVIEDTDVKLLMEQVQVFASAWSLIGGMFDDGSMNEEAEQAKIDLEEMLRSALQRQREASAGLNNNWKDKLATIVDIYFDGIENEPYERTYVAGSFSEQMHELREMFRLEDSLSAAPTPEQDND